MERFLRSIQIWRVYGKVLAIFAIEVVMSIVAVYPFQEGRYAEAVSLIRLLGASGLSNAYLCVDDF